jgi:hypothetical protein
MARLQFLGKRIDFMLELHAIANKKTEGEGEFAVAMTASEKQRFLGDLAGGQIRRAKRTVGSSQYIQMLGRVDSERSQCSRPNTPFLKEFAAVSGLRS